MENPEIYTITIVRNIGIPISFTVRRWKILVYFSIFLLFLAILLYSFIYFVVLLSQTNRLEKNLATSHHKIELLYDQIEKRDLENFAKKQLAAGDDGEIAKKALLNQSDFSTEKILTINKNSLSLDELQGVAAVDIDSFNIKFQRNNLLISVVLKNRSKPNKAIGGYLVVTLVNQDINPPVFKSISGPLGENGFPISYKNGKQYFLVNNNKTKTIKQKISLNEKNKFYTRAMVFIYSYKGSLLNRHSFKIKKDIFPNK